MHDGRTSHEREMTELDTSRIAGSVAVVMPQDQIRFGQEPVIDTKQRRDILSRTRILPTWIGVIERGVTVFDQALFYALPPRGFHRSKKCDLHCFSSSFVPFSD